MELEVKKKQAEQGMKETEHKKAEAVRHAGWPLSRFCVRSACEEGVPFFCFVCVHALFLNASFLLVRISINWSEYWMNENEKMYALYFTSEPVGWMEGALAF